MYKNNKYYTFSTKNVKDKYNVSTILNNIINIFQYIINKF